MESRKQIQFVSSRGKKIDITLRDNMKKVSTMTDLIVNAYRSCVQGDRFKQDFFVGDNTEVEKTIFSLLIQAYKLPMAKLTELIGMDESEVYFRINLYNAGKEPFSTEEVKTSDDHVPFSKQIFLKTDIVANYVKLYEIKHGVLPSNI